MTKATVRTLCCLVVAWGSFTNLAVAEAAAELLVITNAKIYRVDQQNSWAEAMAVDSRGVISAIGTDSYISGRYGTGIDLQGAMVLPGFHDVHLHAIEAGINADFCTLSQFASAIEYRRELRACARAQSTDTWVLAAGVNMAALLESTPDPLALADDISPKRPLLVVDDLGHGAWGNSLAMQAAGFDQQQGNPAGGILVRNKAGELTGVVLEASAQVLIDAAQRPSEWRYRALTNLRYTMSELARHGITSISDAGGYWPREHEKIWHAAAAQDQLRVRASNALFVYPNKPIETQIRELIRRYRNQTDALLRFNQVKIYVDGILSQTTSRLTDPYAMTSPLPIQGDRGFEYFPREQLMRYARELSAAGFQLHFHATGDAGTKLALDAIEQSARGSGPHRITHLYLVDPEDAERFAQLDVFADFQIAPSAAAAPYQNAMRALIGDRANHLLPLGSLLDAGAKITLSSDWDADELSPLLKLQTVLTHPNSRPVNLTQAIRMLTITPAKLLKQDYQVGSLDAGKLADLVVLDRNLFETPVSQLGKVEVLATLFGGRPIYDPQGLFQPKGVLEE